MKRKITCLIFGDKFRYTVKRKEHWWNKWHYVYDGPYPRLFTLPDLIGFHIISLEELEQFKAGDGRSTYIF